MIYDELLQEHQRYNAPNTTPEDTMGLIATIENDLKNAGHEVSDVLHGVLARHLTLANIAAHVAQGAAVVEADPLVQALERAVLPPGAASVVARWVDDLAAILGSVPAPEPVVTQPAPEPAPEPAPAQ